MNVEKSLEQLETLITQQRTNEIEDFYLRKSRTLQVRRISDP